MKAASYFYKILSQPFFYSSHSCLQQTFGDDIQWRPSPHLPRILPSLLIKQEAYAYEKEQAFLYFFQHAQSTTQAFANTKFDIDILKHKILPVTKSKPLQTQTCHATLPCLHRQSVLHINNMPFMYANFYAPYPNFLAGEFDLSHLKVPLGKKLHHKHHFRSPFVFAELAPCMQAKLCQVLHPFLRKPEFIFNVVARKSAFYHRATPGNMVFLEEYFFVSDAILQFFLTCITPNLLISR